METTFAAAINCMDGRVQEFVRAYLCATFGVQFVDMITEPGPDRILFEEVDYSLVESIKRRFRVSVDKHGSRVVAVVGHHDCAGNPVSAERHAEHIRRAVALVQSWDPRVRVLGLWVDEHGHATQTAE